MKAGAWEKRVYKRSVKKDCGLVYFTSLSHTSSFFTIFKQRERLALFKATISTYINSKMSLESELVQVLNCAFFPQGSGPFQSRLCEWFAYMQSRNTLFVVLFCNFFDESCRQPTKGPRYQPTRIWYCMINSRPRYEFHSCLRGPWHSVEALSLQLGDGWIRLSWREVSNEHDRHRPVGSNSILPLYCKRFP